MSTENREHLGGSVDGAVRGEHKFSVADVLTEGWHRSKQYRFPFIQGMLAVVTIFLLILGVLRHLTGELGYPVDDMPSQLGLFFVSNILISPLIVGLEMMGLNLAVGGQINFRHVFMFLAQSTLIILATLLISVTVSISSKLYVLVGLLISIVAMFVPLLIVEKRLSITKAIYVSGMSVGRRLLPIIGVFLPFFGVAMLVITSSILFAQVPVISIIVGLVGLAILLPWFYTVKGILYRELYGVIVAKRDNQTPFIDRFMA